MWANWSLKKSLNEILAEATSSSTLMRRAYSRPPAPAGVVGAWYRDLAVYVNQLLRL